MLRCTHGWMHHAHPSSSNSSNQLVWKHRLGPALCFLKTTSQAITQKVTTSGAEGLFLRTHSHVSPPRSQSLNPPSTALHLPCWWLDLNQDSKRLPLQNGSLTPLFITISQSAKKFKEISNYFKKFMETELKAETIWIFKKFEIHAFKKFMEINF